MQSTLDNSTEQAPAPAINEKQFAGLESLRSAIDELTARGIVISYTAIYSGGETTVSLEFDEFRKLFSGQTVQSKEDGNCRNYTAEYHGVKVTSHQYRQTAHKTEEVTL